MAFEGDNPGVGPSLVFNYFPGLSDRQKRQIEMLMDVYSFWNSRINVISRKDIGKLYERHVLHSLGIAKVITFKPGTQILDVGTGGGFPGIPLAIFFPETKFTLVDSIGKKLKVVSEVVNTLGISNVRMENVRAENCSGTYDFVVSRAVADMTEFHGWVKRLFKTRDLNDLSNGILYLKGGDLSAELSSVKAGFKIYRLSDFFSEEFFESKKLVYIPAGNTEKSK